MGIRANDSLRLEQEPWLPAQPAPPYAGRGRPALGKASRPQMHTPAAMRHGLLTDGDWRPVTYRQDVNGRPLIARQGTLHASESWPAEAETGPLWIVLQRPRGAGEAQSEDLQQFVLSGPATMTLDELAQTAHHRPLIERVYENAKQEVGLDDYQGRSWAGLHHHLALVWLALTWLMLLRRQLPPTPPAFSQSPDALAPEPRSAPAAPSPDPGPEPPPGPLLPQAPDALPPASPHPSPDLAARRAALLIAPWQVRRTLTEWFAGMPQRALLLATLSYRAWRALLLAGSLPSLPVLPALPVPGPRSRCSACYSEALAVEPLAPPVGAATACPSEGMPPGTAAYRGAHSTARAAQASGRLKQRAQPGPCSISFRVASSTLAPASQPVSHPMRGRHPSARSVPGGVLRPVMDDGPMSPGGPPLAARLWRFPSPRPD